MNHTSSLESSMGTVFFTMAALLAAAGTCLAQQDERATVDIKTLEAAGVASDGQSLLDFFRKRTRGNVDRARIEALIRRLGDEDFVTREQATRELSGLGAAAVPALRQAAKEGDAETQSRARKCLEALPGDVDIDVLLAATRVLMRRQPAGHVEALFAFLPDAADEALQAEILALLASTPLKSTDAFLQAARDQTGIRRVAAALVLAKSTRTEDRAALRRLLDDADVFVRWQAAQSLLKAGDRAAINAVLAIVQDGPPLLSLQADELLRQVGGDLKPSLWLQAAQPESRRKARGVWVDWWQTNQTKVDLTKPTTEEGRLGLTAIGESGKEGDSRIWECTVDGKPRWQFKVRNPIAMQMLPGGRVLIADNYGEGQVTEHDFDGRIVWSKKVHWPVSCQRLANGNTFIATQNELMEVTRGGRTISSIRKPKFIYAAQKLANGNIVYLHSSGQIVEVDAEGDQLRVLAIGGVTGWGNIDAQANGNCLVAHYSGNRVSEIDSLGKVLWETEVETPSWVNRLASGNVLVASADARRIVELNRDGKKVWEQATEGRPFCARRR